MEKKPIGLILGTGWDKIITSLRDKKELEFKSVFGSSTSVPGHSGQVIFGTLADKDMIILSGRFHTYEGFSSYEASKTIRYLHDQGVEKVIITSASGGLNSTYKVGDLVILSDVITLFSQSPLSGPLFQDLSNPFSEDLRKKAEETALDLKIRYQKGVYVYVRGPHFESFSDKKALRSLGADVAGMSTVPEVIMANHLKMSVLGFSLVTNLAFVKHSHLEVLKSAKSQERKLFGYLNQLIKKL